MSVAEASKTKIKNEGRRHAGCEMCGPSSGTRLRSSCSSPPHVSPSGDCSRPTTPTPGGRST